MTRKEQGGQHGGNYKEGAENIKWVTGTQSRSFRALSTLVRISYFTLNEKGNH